MTLQVNRCFVVTSRCKKMFSEYFSGFLLSCLSSCQNRHLPKNMIYLNLQVQSFSLWGEVSVPAWITFLHVINSRSMACNDFICCVIFKGPLLSAARFLNIQSFVYWQHLNASWITHESCCNPDHFCAHICAGFLC